MITLDRILKVLPCVVIVYMLIACDTAPSPSPSGQPGKYCPTKDNPNKLCDGMAPRG